MSSHNPAGQLVSRQRNLIELETWLPHRLCPEVWVQGGPATWLCEAQACFQAWEFQHGQDVSVSALHPSGTRKCIGGITVPPQVSGLSGWTKGSYRQDLQRGGARKRANVHDLLAPFHTTVSPDHSVFTPVPGEPS